MVGTGSRLFFALAALGLLGAGLYGVASGGDPVGVMSMGWKGAVGDHFGYAVLSLFGLVVAALGLVVGPGLFVLGLVLLAVTAVEWAVQVWADRATGDPEVNRAIRNRLMAPIEIPVGAVLVILFVVLGISRVLLAVSPLTAVVVASAAASLIMVGAIIVFIRPRHSGTLATAFLLLGALAIIGGGIAGVAAGERDFHEEPAHEAGE